ncbi:ASCH domain-containing protein [Vibrio owensii]|uniref:ASCH domain-containing protein n=1 Tax=Vibrio owensii TaxID=696485 RepID=UPI003395E4C4
MCAANADCKALKSLQRLNKKHGVTSRIEECQSYLLPILFRPPYLGLESDFNTVRLGKAWAARVYVGQEVALIDKEGKQIGKAEVVRVESGDMPEMLAEHARYNHMMLDNPVVDYAQSLHKVLINCYGKLFVEANSGLSVIYLKRKRNK